MRQTELNHSRIVISDERVKASRLGGTPVVSVFEQVDGADREQVGS